MQLHTFTSVWALLMLAPNSIFILTKNIISFILCILILQSLIQIDALFAMGSAKPITLVPYYELPLDRTACITSKS